MKRKVRFLSMIVALAVLIGGYTLINKLNKTEEVSEESGDFALTDKTAEDLTELSWTSMEVDYCFTRSEDEWVKADSDSFPVNQTKLDTLADKVATMTATRKLENVTELADYGLAEPTFELTAKWSDGTETTYAVGSETAFQDGYYLSDSTVDGAVFITESSIADSFEVTPLDLAQQEEIPTVATAETLKVGSTLNLQYLEDGKSINPDHHWFDVTDEIAVDDATVETYVSNLQSLNWQELVSVEASDAELEGWGLDDAQAVKVELGGADSTLTVLLGGNDSEGDYYARLPESRMVYTVAADTVSALLTANLNEIATTDLLNVSAENVASATFMAGDQTWEYVCAMEEVTPEATDAADEEEEITETTLVVTLNGEACDADAFNALWSEVQSLTSDGSAESAEGELLLTVTVTNTNSVSEVLSIYAYDAENYAAQLSDGHIVLVSADTVDHILRTLKQA